MRLPEVPGRTTPGFAFSIVERALLECIAERRFGKKETAQVLAFFGDDPPACAYCGMTPFQRWDHVVPIMRGGDTVLGNVVPACSTCDDSKRDLPVGEWALGNAPRSPLVRGVADIEERLRRVRDYATEHGYRPRPPKDRLTADEMGKLGDLRERLRVARNDADTLIAAYRLRTGLR